MEIGCGSSHSACILEDGALYTWGKGRYGRLGHNDHEPHYKPKQVREGGGGGSGVKEGVRKRRREEEEEERKYGVMVGGKEDEEGEFC